MDSTPTSDQLFGAVEAGGTKFRVAVTNANAEIVEQTRIDTTTPDETLGAVQHFFAGQPQVVALGIASFGPLIVDRSNPDYGSIAPTPKPGWSGTPLLAQLASELGVPGDIQTDVEAAAVAELERGAGQGHSSIAYVTVGTGIGAGVLVDRIPFRGRDHIEIGHMTVRRHARDTFDGVCPFHGDCLEGMASGPAIQARWGTNPSSLADQAEVWEIEAFYLAQLARTLTYTFSPDKILYSGGVGARPELAPLIAAATTESLAGYSVSHANNHDLVATAALGNDAGLLGAALLASSLVTS